MPERKIREIVFPGDHYQRGRRLGELLRETFVPPDVGDLSRGFVRACRRAAESFYPPVGDEFRGLVDGGDFDHDLMEAYFFARLESQVGGCTMFGVAPDRRTEGEGPIVGRNYDWAVADLRWCRLHRYRPRDGMHRVGYTHHWAGCPDVLNERGLYVALASLPIRPEMEPGVQWSILVDMVSETCVSVAEAVDACAAVRHLRPMSYLLADAEGELAVVEATSSGIEVREPEEGVLAAANVAQGGRRVVDHEKAREAVPTPNAAMAVREARRRVCRVRRLLGNLNRVSPVDVQEILTDHEAPVCTGDHDRPDGGRWATIWSGISTPAAGEFRIAPGQPCRYGYRTFRVTGST